MIPNPLIAGKTSFISQVSAPAAGNKPNAGNWYGDVMTGGQNRYSDILVGSPLYNRGLRPKAERATPHRVGSVPERFEILFNIIRIIKTTLST